MEAGAGVERDGIERHRPVKSAEAAFTGASFDLGEKQATNALSLERSIDEERAEPPLTWIELRHSDEAPSLLGHHRFDGPERLDEEMGGVRRVDGAPLRGIVVRSATVLDGPVHEPQHVGDLLEARGAQRERRGAYESATREGVDHVPQSDKGTTTRPWLVRSRPR